MRLTFHPPPAVFVPPQANSAIATVAVKAAFTPFPLCPIAQRVRVSQGDLAMALLSDSRFFFSPTAAEGWIDSATRLAPGGHLTVRPRFVDLPTHLKGVVTQTIAIAAAHCVAEWSGYAFFATPSEMSQMCIAWGIAPLFAKLWPGEGPDYVAVNPTTGTTLLMECKGVSSLMTPKPKDFVKHKVQSMNGNTPAIDAHILSYTYFAPQQRLTTRWFNNRPAEANAADPRHLLLVALRQFTNQLANAGHTYWAYRLRMSPQASSDTTVATFAQRMREDRDFSFEGNVVLSRLGPPVRIAISRAALEFFIELAQNRRWVEHRKEAVAAVHALRKISRERNTFEEALLQTQGVHEVRSVSPTGWLWFTCASAVLGESLPRFSGVVVRLAVASHSHSPSAHLSRNHKLNS